MPERKLDTSNINCKRLVLIQKGFLNQVDISQFVPCGHNKAGQIYKAIREDVKTEGLENCSNVILVKRLLDYMGLTVASVAAAAKQEKELA